MHLNPGVNRIHDFDIKYLYDFNNINSINTSLYTVA